MLDFQLKRTSYQPSLFIEARRKLSVISGNIFQLTENKNNFAKKFQEKMRLLLFLNRSLSFEKGVTFLGRFLPLSHVLY